MSSQIFTRRALLQGSAGAAALGLGLASTGRAFAADLTVGVVYVGAR